jgi:hypothetical protein
MSTTSSITEEFARVVITPRADLRPETGGGGCTHVSAARVFEATTAVRGETL